MLFPLRPPSNMERFSNPPPRAFLFLLPLFLFPPLPLALPTLPLTSLLKDSTGAEQYLPLRMSPGTLHAGQSPTLMTYTPSGQWRPPTGDVCVIRLRRWCRSGLAVGGVAGREAWGGDEAVEAGAAHFRIARSSWCLWEVARMRCMCACKALGEAPPRGNERNKQGARPGPR